MAARKGTMVTVILVPQNTKHKAHEALLTQTPDYFKKAFTGPWKEAEEDVIRVTDIKTAVCE